MLNNTPLPDASTESTEILDLFIRILNKAAAIEKEPVDIGDGILLHASEVHLVEFCARYPDENMTRLAKRLGITKGAVSQTAFRLEKKGYIRRVRQEGDKKTVCLHLTLKGEEACEWHTIYHAKVNEELEGMLSSLEPADRARIRETLHRIDHIFSRCAETREEISNEFAFRKRKTRV
jgi:DNA-binding MarR family transcriptional regulator